MQADPDKIAAISAMAPPRNKAGVQSIDDGRARTKTILSSGNVKAEYNVLLAAQLFCTWKKGKSATKYIQMSPRQERKRDF